MNRPMLLTAICFGIISFISFNTDETFWIISIGLIFIALAVWIFKSFYQIAVVAVLIFLFSFSIVKEKAYIANMDLYSSEYASFDLVAIEDSKRQGKNYNQVTVKMMYPNKFCEDDKLLLSYSGDREIKAGEQFNAGVYIRSLKNSEYKSYYYSNGIYATLNMRKYNRHIGTDEFWSKLQGVRNHIVNAIDNSMTTESSATMKGITIGNKEDFSSEFSANVRNSGVSHVMVVSGLHLTIILGSLFSLIEKFFYNKYLKFLLSILAVFLLVSVCGLTLSAIRAGIMFIIAALAPVLNRNTDSLSALSAAIIIILLFSPYALLGVSLQLSTLATFGIIVIAPFYKDLIVEKFKIENSFLYKIIEIVINSLSATILTLPIVVSAFGTVSLVVLFTNLLVTYPVTLALILNCIAVLCYGIPVLSVISEVLFFITDAITIYINFCINKLGSLRGSHVNIDRGYWPLFLIPILLLLIIIYTCKKKKILLQSKRRIFPKKVGYQIWQWFLKNR